MQNAKIFMIMFSSIQNVKFIDLMRACWGAFGVFGVLRPKSEWRIATFYLKKLHDV